MSSIAPACTRPAARDAPPTGLTDRVLSLKREVERARPGICPERALLWTAYFRKRANRAKPAAIQIAEALAHVLAEKTIAIHPGELLAGNFTSRRVGGMIQPELAGIAALQEIYAFPTRKENPLEISRVDRLRLARIFPFWLRRTLAWKACPSLAGRPGFVVRNLGFRDWVLNELGGIAHFAPNYERLLAIGAEGAASEARARRREFADGSDEAAFLDAAALAGESLARFGERYAVLADDMAESERDPARRAELRAVAAACERVPRHGARSFREAVQSVLLTHIAVATEGLDVSICPGRMDQYLRPYYEADLASGRTTREDAKELLACFCIKLCEVVPVWSRAVNRCFSGLPSYQTVCVGGTDRAGNDATGDLSYLLLEVTDALRMREPNFHARVHRASPPEWRTRLAAVLAAGANTPALYNDDVIVPALTRRGVSVADARDYSPIGCVEPASQGRSFSSTDAALVNVPVALERALNEGRRFGSRRVTGARTMPVLQMKTMDDVTAAFSAQLAHQLDRLIRDLRWAEEANADHHPTPLASLLIDGCLESARDVTAGGAKINFSGVQCVGPADVGDSLAAIRRLVFDERRVTLGGLVDQLRRDLPDEALAARMRRCPKFGNDDPEADRWTAFVLGEFVRLLESHGDNTRGGAYVTGLYSTTTHEVFGRTTGALPSGRRRGEPFASGIAPANGMDRLGPTALLNSMNRLDYAPFSNGVNFNLKFAADVLKGERGAEVLESLLATYFDRGGMQVQVNVFDAQTLRRAQARPDRYPNLLVRVSGYSAYFHDLTRPVQDEIIARTENRP